ncbi:HAD-like domain-containing protein [Gaertneriomyces semiglobifer]|nr:HAD-like domain-containing protein [Gaertneriomyces semiglobifer]
MYKAIFFDIGGVCVHSPLEGIRAYERSRGFPENYLNVAIQSRTPHGAFHRLERNELTLEEFYPLFGREMSDPGNREVYREWMKKRAPNQQQQSGLEWDETMDWTVDGKSFFFQMMKEASKVDEVVVGCVRKLKEIGKWKVVALTNNFIIPRTTPTTNTTNNNAGSPTKHEEEDDLSFLLPPPHLTSLFDHYLESSILHLRKPDPAIFLRACDMVGVHPKHVIMIDDIGENLKSARGVGMTTVRVYPGKAREAMVQLEGLLGVEILERKSRL